MHGESVTVPRGRPWSRSHRRTPREVPLERRSGAAPIGIPDRGATPRSRRQPVERSVPSRVPPRRGRTVDPVSERVRATPSRERIPRPSQPPADSHATLCNPCISSTRAAVRGWYPPRYGLPILRGCHAFGAGGTFEGFRSRFGRGFVLRGRPFLRRTDREAAPLGSLRHGSGIGDPRRTVSPRLTPQCVLRRQETK
jgi:hypothetical protein